jgi:hypothetical protein
MNKEELKKKFIVSADSLKEKIESLIDKAMRYCVVEEKGVVHISIKSLGAKDKIKLVLAARSLAAQLVDTISSKVTVAELVVSTGIPENQIHARANEIVKERFAASPQKGTYTANPHKIEEFLDSLATRAKSAAAN